MKILIILSTVLIFYGCSSSVNFIKYHEDIYPPTSSVDVLRSKPVSKDSIELGELSLKIKKSNQEEAALKLNEKAKELGADAIILLGENSEGSVLVPLGNLYASVDMRYIKAIAIKFRKIKNL